MKARSKRGTKRKAPQNRKHVIASAIAAIQRRVAKCAQVPVALLLLIVLLAAQQEWFGWRRKHISTQKRVASCCSVARETCSALPRCVERMFCNRGTKHTASATAVTIAETSCIKHHVCA